MDKQNQFQPYSINPEIIVRIEKLDLTEFDYDSLVQIGIEASEVKTYTQWILGKLGNAVSTRYGALTQYAGEINQKYEVLQQYVNTYRKFTKEDPDFSPDKYKGAVPWGMLQLAATKSESPQKLVDELQDDGIRTIEGAYKKIKEKETGIKIPHKPKVNMKWDDSIRKFKIQFRSEDLHLIDWNDVKNQLANYLEAFK